MINNDDDQAGYLIGSTPAGPKDTAAVIIVNIRWQATV